MHKNKIHYMLVIIITILLFIFLFLNIKIGSIYKAIKVIDLKLFFAAMSISIALNIFLGTEQWRQSLRICNLNITFLETLLIKLGSMPFKRIVPLKAGEIVKPLYLKKNYDFPLTSGIFSVFLPFFSNSFTAILFIFSGICILGKIYPFVYFILSLLIIIIFGRQLFLKYYENTNIGKIKIISFILLSLISLIYIFSEIVVVYILFSAFNVDISLHNLLIFVPLTILITSIPVTFQGLGTREVCIIFFFSEYTDQAVLLSIGIMYSFVEAILPLLISMFFLKDFLNKYLSKKYI